MYIASVKSWKHLTDVPPCHLQRGKWRPRLEQLAASNSEADVKRVSEAAFKIGSGAPADANKKLCELKGVGPATASAILSSFDPEQMPFESDEAVLAMGLGKAEYTAKFVENYRKKMSETLEADSWSGMDDLEKACWAWVALGQPPASHTPKVETGEKRAASASATVEEEAIDDASKRPKKKAKQTKR
jgi:hypothetical protein